MPMYSADKDKIANSLVISSQAAALREIQRWLAENQLDRARDGDGWTWTMLVKISQVGDPDDPRRVLWQVRVQLHTEMSGPDLIANGVLAPDRDARLLVIIGDASVPMAMKPVTQTAPNEADARSALIESLPKIKDTFAHYRLGTIKRALVHRWVDESCSFDRLRPKMG